MAGVPSALRLTSPYEQSGYGACAEEHEGRDPMKKFLLSFATTVTLECTTQAQPVGTAMAPESREWGKATMVFCCFG